MPRSSEQLRADALAIWQAGVDAVDSKRLVLENVSVDGAELLVGPERIELASLGRILVVGAGKAGAGMAGGIEAALGPSVMEQKRLSGWVNVPEGCGRPLQRITLHAARPKGVNEPTEAGVEGASRILELVDELAPEDLCLCLISGGGSALLPAPANQITLADKQAVTKHLSSAGADIRELNTVRKQLSRIKGGGLARACRAGRLITLIISDVIGDPLDMIASGPTVPDSTTSQDALAVLEKFGGRRAPLPRAVFDYLQQPSGSARASPSSSGSTPGPSDGCLQQPSGSARPSPEKPSAATTNLIIGNNAVAVDAAGAEAARRGYRYTVEAATAAEGQAEEVGRQLADAAWRMRHEEGPDCLITGGEPVVQLVPASERGLGGRNQQLVLAALLHLLDKPKTQKSASALEGIALLSGGTDGEDGPTDAAGAIVDASVVEAMRRQSLAPAEFLQRNDAYHFFEPLEALIKTGPTDTNVCDVRVVTVQRD